MFVVLNWTCLKVLTASTSEEPQGRGQQGEMKGGFKVGPFSADKSRRKGRGGRRKMAEGVWRVILERRGAGGQEH